MTWFKLVALRYWNILCTSSKASNNLYVSSYNIYLETWFCIIICKALLIGFLFTLKSLSKLYKVLKTAKKILWYKFQ